jgi:hypothetical protein
MVAQENHKIEVDEIKEFYARKVKLMESKWFKQKDKNTILRALHGNLKEFYYGKDVSFNSSIPSTARRNILDDSASTHKFELEPESPTKKFDDSSRQIALEKILMKSEQKIANAFSRVEQHSLVNRSFDRCKILMGTMEIANK